MGRVVVTTEKQTLCPIDGTPSVVYEEVASGRLYACQRCDLRFYAERRRPADLMDRAYSGGVVGAHMTDYWFRREYLASERFDFLASPAVSASLTWIRANARRGATILDVGAGRGLHLRRLRAMGYNVIGLDIADGAARALRDQGFVVHHGPVRSYAADLPEPQFVTCNFVLHHAADPVGFLRDIAEVFPSATLVVAQGLHPAWMNEIRGVPATVPQYPRNVTGWSSTALRNALHRAGYDDVGVWTLPPSWRDVHLPLQARAGQISIRATPRSRRRAVDRAWARTLRAMLPVAARSVVIAKAVVFSGIAAYARLQGRSPAAAVAIARMSSESSRRAPPSEPTEDS